MKEKKEECTSETWKKNDGKHFPSECGEISEIFNITEVTPVISRNRSKPILR